MKIEFEFGEIGFFEGWLKTKEPERKPFEQKISKKQETKLNHDSVSRVQDSNPGL